MTWLLAHMWLALLFAAAFGGLIGWAFRHVSKRDSATMTHERASAGAGLADAEARARIVELETQLAAERDELTALRASAVPGEPQPSVPEEPEEGSVEWRNRYLESRVRFLEKQLVEAEERTVEQPKPPEEDDEATRLVWRNRYLEGRVRYLEDELAKGGSLTLATPQAPAAAKTKAPTGSKPVTLDGPRGGKADNLKQIGGIGPKIESLLNNMGVYHFDQIAGWTDTEIAWVNSEISFKGRIERENWVSQAAALAKGLQPTGKSR